MLAVRRGSTLYDKPQTAGFGGIWQHVGYSAHAWMHAAYNYNYACIILVPLFTLYACAQVYISASHTLAASDLDGRRTRSHPSRAHMRAARGGLRDYVVLYYVLRLRYGAVCASARAHVKKAGVLYFMPGRRDQSPFSVLA